MLKELSIQNIILIESQKIEFKDGFNVISGETGSGKSAIMETLKLIGGARADSNLIRKGCEKGVVEALFDIQNIPAIYQDLYDSGINHEKDDYLIIKREISLTGKSRNFANNQTVQLALLKQIGTKLFDIVGQHANRRLFETDEHRKILDIYGNLDNEMQEFANSWKNEVSLRNKLEEMNASESKRLRELDRCQAECEELETAAIKEGEEEELFTEYTKLVNAEDLTQKADSINQILSTEHGSIIENLKNLKTLFEDISSIDQSLSEYNDPLKNATLELEEIAYTLSQYQSQIEFNPQRMEVLNNRLSLINSLKRKYGPSVQDVLNYHKELELKIVNLENSDLTIENLRNSIEKLQIKNNKLATDLTKKRQSCSITFQKLMTKQINSLNMEGSEFHVHITEKKRSSTGDDHIEFLLKPNVGEKQVPLKECASGGELSRVLLSIQTLISEQNKTSTLVFDEIDSNIGGATATVIGQNLKEIGERHQVICITHFPQVAKCAEYHLQIAKKTENGRTFTQVKKLDISSREKELVRMSGGHS